MARLIRGQWLGSTQQPPDRFDFLACCRLGGGEGVEPPNFLREIGDNHLPFSFRILQSLARMGVVTGLVQYLHSERRDQLLPVENLEHPRMAKYLSRLRSLVRAMKNSVWSSQSEWTCQSAGEVRRITNSAIRIQQSMWRQATKPCPNMAILN